MPMGQLTQVLRDMKQFDDERLLVGPKTVDDAGVVRIGPEDGLAAGSEALLVQTVSNAAGFWVRVVGAVVETAVSHELAAPIICVTIVLVMPEVAHLGVDAE